MSETSLVSSTFSAVTQSLPDNHIVMCPVAMWSGVSQFSHYQLDAVTRNPISHLRDTLLPQHVGQ